MSVLIKGTEMPTVCDECWALDDNYDYPRCRVTEEQRGYNFNCRERRMDRCPLIPVPDHGRLIDADALWKEEKSADALHKLRPKGKSVIYDAGFLAGYRAAAQIASKMPTIIPADKDGA